VSNGQTRTAGFRETIEGRHSVRQYDPSAQISEQELRELIQETTLAPSAMNLQTWRFLILTDPALKQKLFPITNGQRHVLDASAVIVIFGDLDAFQEPWRERIFTKAVAEGRMTEEAKENALATARRSPAKSLQAMRDSLLINGSLAAMQLMLAARARGYDTVPMTGYDVAAFREAFAVPDHLVNVLMLALGKAAHPVNATVRLDVDDLVYWNALPPR